MVRIVAFVAVLGLLALFITPTLRGYLDQRAQISDVREQIAQDQAEIAELEGELEDWRDPDFVERQARERLHFVMPGEMSYTVIDDTAEQVMTEQLPGIATDAAQDDLPWYGEVWESVKATGEPAPDVEELEDLPLPGPAEEPAPSDSEGSGSTGSPADGAGAP